MNPERKERMPATAHSHPRSDFKPLRSWSPNELACLRAMAPNRPFDSEIAAAFPGRSIRSVRSRLTQLRQDEGLRLNSDGPQVLDRDDPGIDDRARLHGWRKAAAISNANFLKALARAGYPVAACG